MSSPACADPMPTPLNAFDRGALAVAIATEGRDAYWIAPYSALAGVYRAPRTGGEPTLLASVRSFQDDAYDWDLALADRTVFFAETGDAGVSPHPGYVARIDGLGHITELAQGERHPCRGGGHPRRLTLDATHVYWTEDVGRYLGDPSDPIDPADPLCRTTDPVRRLRSVPQSGGVARTLADVTSLNVAVDAGFVYYTRGDSLLRLDKGSLAEKTVASGLTLDEPVLHRVGVWIHVGGRDGCLYTVHSQTGLMRTACPGAESTQGRIDDFASDTRYIYWTYAAGPNGRPSGIYRMRLEGDAPVELRFEGPTWGLAVDAEHLYWGSDSTVYRQCK